MAQVQGHCDDKFAEVRRLLQHFIDTGEELGASIVVDLDGKSVVDIYGGYADQDQKRAWERDTITNVFSSTKTVTALAALMLVDRSLLDVNAKVSKYWPEFAGNGKEGIEIRHVLSHNSGLSGWEEPMTVVDLFDFEKAVAKLANQSPWWTPGTGSGYHSLTFGFLVGELVRRTTGKTLKHFVHEEMEKPLNADFQIGAREQDWPRVSDIVPFRTEEAAAPPKLEPKSLAFKTTMNPEICPELVNQPEWRNAELGAANGHTNARGLARILSAITLGGSVNGHRLLSPGTIDLIFQEQSRGIDKVVGASLRFGIGFGLTSKGDTLVDSWVPAGRVCFWGGWGGSMILMDLDRKVTISYVMNKMENVGLGNSRTRAYVAAIYQALAII